MARTKDEILKLFHQYNDLDALLVEPKTYEIKEITNFYIKHEKEYKERAHIYDSIMKEIDDQLDLFIMDLDLRDFGQEFIKKAIEQNENLLEKSKETFIDEKIIDMNELINQLNNNLNHLKSIYKDLKWAEA